MNNPIPNIVKAELKEFEDKFCLYSKSNAPRWIFGRPLRENLDSDDLKSFLLSSQLRLLEQVRLELVGEIQKKNKIIAEQVSFKTAECIEVHDVHYAIERIGNELTDKYNSALSDSLAIINRIMKHE